MMLRNMQNNTSEYLKGSYLLPRPAQIESGNSFVILLEPKQRNSEKQLNNQTRKSKVVDLAAMKSLSV